MGDRLSEAAELYHRMQMEMLNTAREWRSGSVQAEDLWDAAFRDGFYDRLSQNFDLAIDFLVVTERGPTWHYKKYLNTVEDSNDILALVALSALVNDALH